MSQSKEITQKWEFFHPRWKLKITTCQNEKRSCRSSSATLSIDRHRTEIERSYLPKVTQHTVKWRAKPNSHSSIQSVTQSMNPFREYAITCQALLGNGVTNKMRFLSQVTHSLMGEESPVEGKIQWGQ